MVASSHLDHSATVESIAKNAAALCMGARKRNFIKIYELCKDDSQLLYEGIQLAQRKYLTNHNPTHIFKSLVYFVGVENDPVPKTKKASWDDVKKYFRLEVPRIARDLLLSN